VLGQAIWRVVPDAAVEEGLSEAFAPDFDVPDQFVDDYRRMTFSSYNEAGDDEYSDEQPLDERLAAVGLPLLVIFGSEDRIYDEREALAAYADVPGARTRLVRGAGHSPNVERPAQTARMVLEFARRLPWGAASTRNGG
jgi:pimeloyl-ACP methyl ester carboxylesterase